MRIITKTLGATAVALSLMAGVAATRPSITNDKNLEPDRKEVKWDNSKSNAGNAIDAAESIAKNMVSTTIEAADKATESQNTIPLGAAAVLAGLGFVGAKGIERKQKAKAVEAELLKDRAKGELEYLDGEYIVLGKKQQNVLRTFLSVRCRILECLSLLSEDFKKMEIGDERMNGLSIDDQKVFVEWYNKKLDNAPSDLEKFKKEYRTLLNRIKDIDVEKSKISKEYCKIQEANPDITPKRAKTHYRLEGYCASGLEITEHKPFNMKCMGNFEFKENPDDITLEDDITLKS